MATPKQIRELMKVDGLTNDEVKSHLQVSNMELNCTYNLVLGMPNFVWQYTHTSSLDET